VSDLNLKIEKIVQETSTVKAYVLKSADGAALPEFTAGAHVDVMVTLEDGKTDKRSYSLASDPKDTSAYTLGVLREKEGKGGSAFMHDKLKEGDVIEASNPKNHFPLDGEAEDNLLIAGGIGVTPILAMARSLTAQGTRFNMHYAARAPEEMAFKTDVEAVCGDNGHLYFDGGDPTKGINLKDLLSNRPGGLHLFVCGPGGLIEAVRTTAADLGWPENTVHYEVFKPEELSGEDTELQVTLSENGQTYTIPADKSILDVLLDEGVDIDYDCKMGICGLCAVKVIDGDPDHRDYVLTEGEKTDEQLFCPCISRAKGGSITLES
jgi:vanillate monooxygenase ferredoxin subunit